MTINRSGLLALAFALTPLGASAVNPAVWTISESITPSTELLTWTSPTAVDLDFTNYLFSYEITRADVQPIIGSPLDVLPQLGDLTSDAGVAPVPYLLVDERIEESYLGVTFAADIKIEIDAAGHGQAVISNVDLPSLVRSFNLEATVMVEGLPNGDYDLDFDVDADDYARWRGEYGLTGEPGVGEHHADGNLDGAVDAADYTLWRDNLGVDFHPDSAATAAPEPLAVVGVALSLVVTIGRRQRD